MQALVASRPTAPIARTIEPAPIGSAILALDLGTATGWALRAHDGLITSGTDAAVVRSIFERFLAVGSATVGAGAEPAVLLLDDLLAGFPLEWVEQRLARAPQPSVPEPQTRP